MASFAKTDTRSPVQSVQSVRSARSAVQSTNSANSGPVERPRVDFHVRKNGPWAGSHISEIPLFEATLWELTASVTFRLKQLTESPFSDTELVKHAQRLLLEQENGLVRFMKELPTFYKTHPHHTDKSAACSFPAGYMSYQPPAKESQQSEPMKAQHIQQVLAELHYRLTVLQSFSAVRRASSWDVDFDAFLLEFSDYLCKLIPLIEAQAEMFAKFLADRTAAFSRGKQVSRADLAKQRANPYAVLSLPMPEQEDTMDHTLTPTPVAPDAPTKSKKNLVFRGKSAGKTARTIDFNVTVPKPVQIQTPVPNVSYAGALKTVGKPKQAATKSDAPPMSPIDRQTVLNAALDYIEDRVDQVLDAANKMAAVSIADAGTGTGAGADV
jgi:hypothetical protein